MHSAFNVMGAWLLAGMYILSAWAGFIDQEKDAAPVWWLEGCSYPIQVLDKERVKVLVRSDELQGRPCHSPSSGGRASCIT